MSVFENLESLQAYTSTASLGTLLRVTPLHLEIKGRCLVPSKTFWAVETGNETAALSLWEKIDGNDLLPRGVAAKER